MLLKSCNANTTRFLGLAIFQHYVHERVKNCIQLTTVDYLSLNPFVFTFAFVLANSQGMKELRIVTFSQLLLT